MGKPMYGSAEEQLARRERILRLVVDYHVRDFDAMGAYTGTDAIVGMRERLWFAYAFLAEGSEEACLAGNRIIEAGPYYPCHFAPQTSIQILTKYDERLTAEARRQLWSYLENVIENSASDEMDFVGVNDNFPSMSTFITLIGGRLLNRPHLIAIGERRLNQLKGLLTRRGFASEFNSPTYTGVQLNALAELANYLEEGELKQIALQCEERIWADQLTHLHLPTAQVAGPYSRAYTVDSAGHTHHSRYALYALLGDRLPINPLNTLFASRNGEQGEIIHHSPAFMQVSVANMLNTIYHCPEELVRHALGKTTPYQVNGTFEIASSTDARAAEDPADPDMLADMTEYPAAVGQITTYMTEDYALGTSTHEFHNGNQTDSFHLLLRRDPRGPEAQRNLRAVYARYLINGRRPGQTNRYDRLGFESEDSFLMDEGRKLALQHERTAMVLYKPKRFGRLEVTSLKLSVIIPCHYGEPDEIWLGDRQLDGQTGESEVPCPVYVRDGAVYMAFHPLLPTNYGRAAAVKVERAHSFLLLSFYNFEGERRDFDPKTFMLTGNGLVAQVSSEAEVGSFETFRLAADAVRISDSFFSSSHSRRTVIRRTSVEAPGVSLSCEYSPISEGIKKIEVNGRSPEFSRLSISGYDVGTLPFFNS